MKKSLLTIVFVFCVVIATSVAYAKDYDIDFSANNWINPIGGTMKTNAAFDYMSKTYEENNPKNGSHPGIDIVSALGSPVYAIADGVVYYIKDCTINCATYNEAVIFVRHETDNGKVFTAVYGHCQAIDLLQEGDIVSAGDQIGNVVRYNFPDHLHFGINMKAKIPSDHWGNIGIGVDEYGLGWRKPSDFLSANTPRSVSTAADMVFDDIEYIYDFVFTPHSHSYSLWDWYYRPYPRLIYLVVQEDNLSLSWGVDWYPICPISEWWDSSYRYDR